MNKMMIKDRLKEIKIEVAKLQQEAFLLEQQLKTKDIDLNENHVQIFYSYFKGRKDVYAKRGNRPDAKTGKISYYTQIDWSKKPEKVYLPLRGRVLLEHLKGTKSDRSDVIGIYPTFPDETCNFLVFDFDDHASNSNEMSTKVKDEVDALRNICEINQVDALVERSRSGKGAHIWIFFEEPIPAEVARKFGTALLNKGADSINLKDFSFYDRMIPAQDYLPRNRKTGQSGLGNMVALPLQGRALMEGNSAFVDENWQAYADQWQALTSTKKLSKEFIEEKTMSWGSNELTTNQNYDGSKPWERPANIINTQDVSASLEV